jgi:hypothetical protein
LASIRIITQTKFNFTVGAVTCVTCAHIARAEGSLVFVSGFPTSGCHSSLTGCSNVELSFISIGRGVGSPKFLGLPLARDRYVQG